MNKPNIIYETNKWDKPHFRINSKNKTIYLVNNRNQLNYAMEVYKYYDK